MLENIKLTIPFFLISQDGGEGGGEIQLMGVRQVRRTEKKV